MRARQQQIIAISGAGIVVQDKVRLERYILLRCEFRRMS